MKKIWMSLLWALLPLSGLAQEVSYALPSTSVTIKVEVRQESFFAGPYAAYAKRMLNTSVNDKDLVSATVSRVSLIPHVEADPSSWSTCDVESAALLELCSQGLISLGNNPAPVSWRFPAPVRADFTGKGLTEPEKEVTQIVYEEMQTDTALISVPVEHKVLVEKTLEDKASDAADMILSVRKDRLNVASGNTDATYSGEAMRAALQELDRIEKEYMALFCGYTVVSRQEYTFEVVPLSTVKDHRYLVFRLTDEGTLGEGTQGVPYYLELEPEETFIPDDTADKRKVKGVVRYRIPLVCKLRFTRNGETLLQTRLPFYQLGKESSLYLMK